MLIKTHRQTLSSNSLRFSKYMDGSHDNSIKHIIDKKNVTNIAGQISMSLPCSPDELVWNGSYDVQFNLTSSDSH